MYVYHTYKHVRTYTPTQINIILVLIKKTETNIDYLMYINIGFYDLSHHKINGVDL